MIKITKYIYVHFTALMLFVLCWFNRNLEILLMSYTAIFLHELAHLISALAIGLKPSHIVFFPFGVNLKLKNSLVYSISDEIILYLAGPLFNAFLALLVLIVKGKNLFYYNNLGLFLFNMLPILPMDGAVILKKILSRYLGEHKALLIMRTISALLFLVLLGVIVLVLINGKVNFSLFFTAIFLLANIFTCKEKYHLDFTKELMFYAKKSNADLRSARVYIIKENTALKKLVRHFVPGRHYVIFKESADGKISETLSEKEVIERLLRN